MDIDNCETNKITSLCTSRSMLGGCGVNTKLWATVLPEGEKYDVRVRAICLLQTEAALYPQHSAAKERLLEPGAHICATSFPPSQASNYRAVSPPLPLLWQLARRKPDVAARKLGYGLACCTGLPASSLVTALFRAKPHSR